MKNFFVSDVDEVGKKKMLLRRFAISCGTEVSHGSCGAQLKKRLNLYVSIFRSLGFAMSIHWIWCLAICISKKFA